jgi:hypothetical protein
MNSSSYQRFGETADFFFRVGNSYTLKIEAVVSSETLLMERLSTQRNFVEDSTMQRAIVFIYGIKILPFVMELEKAVFLVMSLLIFFGGTEIILMLQRLNRF